MKCPNCGKDMGNPAAITVGSLLSDGVDAWFCNPRLGGCCTEVIVPRTQQTQTAGDG